MFFLFNHSILDKCSHPELVSGQQTNAPILRPAPLNYGPSGPMHSAMRGGEHMSERTRAREQAERQMAEAQALWEACATEESWANRPAG